MSIHPQSTRSPNVFCPAPSPKFSQPPGTKVRHRQQKLFPHQHSCSPEPPSTTQLGTTSGPTHLSHYMGPTGPGASLQQTQAATAHTIRQDRKARIPNPAWTSTPIPTPEYHSTAVPTPIPHNAPALGQTQSNSPHRRHRHGPRLLGYSQDHRVRQAYHLCPSRLRQARRPKRHSQDHHARQASNMCPSLRPDTGAMPQNGPSQDRHACEPNHKAQPPASCSNISSTWDTIFSP